MESTEQGAYKVLYVEDQPDMIQLVRLTLRKLGCQVFGANDGGRGLQMMRDLQPDLVLLDLMLPGWDGWRIRDEMMNDDELCAIPVILVTARVVNSKLPMERQLPNADAYVTKPFSLLELRSAVQQVLERRVGLAQVALMPNFREA